MRRTTGIAAVWLVGGIIAATAVLFIGPDARVTCGQGHMADRAAQGLSGSFGAGHIDGPTRSACVVPSDPTWVAAAAVLVIAIVGAVVMSRRAVVEPSDHAA